MAPLCSRRHRFPPEMICDLALSPLYPELYRDVEELLAERGLDISYETALGAKVRPPDRASAAPESPWAERSLTIDHVVGAANCRSLRDDEPHETRYRRDAVDLGDVSGLRILLTRSGSADTLFQS